MIRISQLKLQIPHDNDTVYNKILKTLRISENELLSWKIEKKSLDARKKPLLFYVYTIAVKTEHDRKILKRCRNKAVSYFEEYDPVFELKTDHRTFTGSPIIVGSGPAGLFCGYYLALSGCRPIVIERGEEVGMRRRQVEDFWNGGKLMTDSNVQFGEGGAGTFSDGKLNTLVKDKDGRNRKVLEILVRHGAPEEIRYESKPHIGTDRLADVVTNMRRSICDLGGQYYFNSRVTDILITDEKGSRSVRGVKTENTSTGQSRTFDSRVVIMAVGNSARDTFEMLYEKRVPILPKPFAVGVRIQHLQKMIDQVQYGGEFPFQMPPACYKLSKQLENGNGVYSFCMCPGGYVVDASSESGMKAVNGMSYHTRAGLNANSAIIVTLSPEQYGDGHPLSGIAFQRILEKRAFDAGGGAVPLQRFEDFCNGVRTTQVGAIAPQIKGKYEWGELGGVFPAELKESLIAGIRYFDSLIPGFASPDAVLAAAESRTSSPVRIIRNDNLQAEIDGLFPCGEGAGYAGGITSSAMDGMKVAQAVIHNFSSFDSR